MSKFSKRLKELRNSKNLSQQKLADYIKMSKSSINMYERGEREPGIETLEAFADFFNIDLNYLLGKSDIPNQLLLNTTGKSETKEAQHKFNTRLCENTIQYCHNNKISSVKLTKAQMDVFVKMIEAFKSG